MSKDLEAALGGSRETAKAAVSKVLQKLEAFKDAKSQLQYGVAVLRSLCVIVAKANGQHHDLYCDVLVRVLGPRMQPNANAKYWAVYLEHVRYFHYLMTERKLYTESAKVFTYISGYQDILQSETDYKLVLSLYLHHLLSQYSHKSVNASAAQALIVQVLDALIVLFQIMRQCNVELNFNYAELIAEFVQYLVPKRAMNTFVFLCSLPAQKTRMYEAFFELMSGMRGPVPSSPELAAHCQRHLEAVAVFLQLDVVDRLSEQVALRHLRACRDMRLLQSDKSTGYVFSLLYYLLKLAYGLPSAIPFKEVYTDLVKKLTSFFEKMGDTLMQERWFTDVPVLIAVLLTHMQPHTSKTFSAFWQQMDAVECYTAHMELILSCIKLAPRIVETKLLTLNCCTSARKHTILTLVNVALGAYSSYMQNLKEESVDAELLASFQHTFMQIVRHGISVVDTLVCINPQSHDLKMLFALFGQLTRMVRTPQQARFCVSLSEQLLRIRQKFSPTDWTLLLRRIYKTAALGDDHQLTTELQVAYIVSIMHESVWPDVVLLHNQIGIFYTNSPHVPNGKCILQLHEESRSAFKLPLESQQKQLLHWWEVQQFHKYHRTNTQLQHSLMRYSICQYDEVLVACVGNLQPEVAACLEEIIRPLRLKAQETAGLTRVEHLTLAHACTALLHDQLRLQKKTLVIEMKCQEDNLEDLLQRKELTAISVQNEVRLVKMAEEALLSFADFYNKADIEHISSSEAYIDWERIIEDLASIALYFQLTGYIESAMQTWLLHYRITNCLEDTHNSLRSLAYFCEHADYFEQSEELDLQQELDTKQTFILQNVERLPLLPKRNQNYVLMCVCQLAYFYARRGNICYAQILLQLVQLKHSALPEQQGKYNIVLGTVDVVKFRILWKLRGREHNQTELAQKCLLREVEQTLERFRTDIFKVTSSEVMSYTIMLLSLIQEVAECAANRLCDYFVNAFFAGIFNILLQSGSALRLTQLLIMWAWVNLQMEFVKKAQVKIKLIECIMGVKGLEQLRQLSEEAMKKPAIAPLPSLEMLHPGMEIMRKVAQVPVSPVKINCNQISPSTRRHSLKRFLQGHENEALQQYEVLQWSYFITGCLSARSHFLAENFEQLDDFYEHCQQWFDERKNKFLQIYFQNIKLLSMQHYVNYLRLRKKFEKAVTCIEHVLKDCALMEGNVDCAYRVNFLLQLRATKIEMLQVQRQQADKAKLRRALAFNLSPERPRLTANTNATEVSSLMKEGVKKKTKQNFTVFNSDAAERRNKYKSIGADVGMRKIRRKIGGTSDSSSPESELENILNNCQSVQSIDLVDSDDQKDAAVVAVSKPVKTRQRPCSVKNTHHIRLNDGKEKRMQNVLSITERIEAICLSDSDESDSARSVLDTVKKKPAQLPDGAISPNAQRRIAKRCLLNVESSRKRHQAQSPKIVHFSASVNGENLEKSTETAQYNKHNTASDNQELETIELIDVDNIDNVEDGKDKEQVAPPIKTPKSKSAGVKSNKPKTAASKQSKRDNAEPHPEQPTSTTDNKPETAPKQPLEIEITKKTMTTATKTKTKTEIRTLTVISKETAVRLVSPRHVSNEKSNSKKDAVNELAGSTCATNTTGMKTRTRTRKAQVVNDENAQPSTPITVTVNSSASRRRRP